MIAGHLTPWSRIFSIVRYFNSDVLRLNFVTWTCKPLHGFVSYCHLTWFLLMSLRFPWKPAHQRPEICHTLWRFRLSNRYLENCLMFTASLLLPLGSHLLPKYMYHIDIKYRYNLPAMANVSSIILYFTCGAPVAKLLLRSVWCNKSHEICSRFCFPMFCFRSFISFHLIYRWFSLRLQYLYG